MSDISALPGAAHFRIYTRSMGVKLLVVCVLALCMMIPMLFIGGLVGDRTRRADDVIREVSGHVGGQETFLGPTLAVPYSIPPQVQTDASRHGIYLVFPAQASAAVKTLTEERQRSLFKVPVYRADLKFDASFDLAGVPTAAPAGAVLDWSRAELAIGVSDVRGALADGIVAIDGKAATLTPAQTSPDMTIGSDPSQRTKLVLLGVSAAAAAKPDARFNVTSTLRFSGAEHLAVLAYGKTTQLAMQGDWPNPGFDGGFLPVSRTVSKNGFGADWSVPFIARGVRAEGPADSIIGLDSTALGVSFVELADPYQSVNRSLKYALLFVGLLFISYFVFEVTTGRRVHPAQYVLVGIAQTTFYLLLLSLAERTGFDLAFAIAGAATVLLLSANAGWIFVSRLQGLRALVVFSLLYVLIYFLLRLEDNALLVGAVASFLAIAAAMYFTRKIDWYGSFPLPSGADQSSQSVVPRNAA